MKELYILDGSWYVFRAYYGMPELTNADGQPVHAVYGFFKMLFSLWKEGPEHLCIARDSPWPTLRKQAVDTYKANRVQQPDDFKRQMRAIKMLVKELGIPHAEYPWYEADDIIATLVHHKRDSDHYTIVSSDKDLKQLVSDYVVHYDAMKEKRTWPQDFVAEYGFAPTYMWDFLALVGDASDNIPGVHGIGPKTAQWLIAQYHTLDAIYNHLDEIPGKTQEKLRDGKDAAYQSKQLIDLYILPDFVPDCADFVWHPDIETLQRVLIGEWKFSSLAPLLSEMHQQQRVGVQWSLF